MTIDRVSDATLVRQARTGGGRDAFGQIAIRYYANLLQVARAYSRNGDDAADAVQDALLMAYVHLGQLQDPERLGPWLRRVTVNACRQDQRRRKPTVALETIEEIADAGIAATEDRLIVEQTLACLSPETRLTVTLYYQRGLCLEEIAAFQEVPVTTIKSRLRNARTRLQKEGAAMLEELSTEMGSNRAPQLLRRLDSTGEVHHLAFSPDGTKIVTAAILEINEQKFTSAIGCWESATGNPLWVRTHTSWAFSPLFLPDSQRIAVSAGLPGLRGGATGQLLILEAQTGETLQIIDEVRPAKTIAISPDGRSIALGSQEPYETYRATGDQGMAAIYDLATGQRILKVAPHLNYVTALTFAPDGATFATSSHLRDADPEAEKIWRSGDVRIWDTASGALRHKLARPSDRGMRHVIAFSPDGILLAAPNGPEGEVLLWNTTTGVLVRTLAGSGEPVFTLAFSPDGTLLACGCGDNAVRVWNPKTGRLERVLTEFTHCIYALAFSPDGKRLVTADKSGAVQFWAL